MFLANKVPSGIPVVPNLPRSAFEQEFLLNLYSSLSHRSYAEQSPNTEWIGGATKPSTLCRKLWGNDVSEARPPSTLLAVPLHV